MKRKLLIVLLFTVITSLIIPTVKISAASDVIEVDYGVSESNISNGEYFTITLKFDWEDSLDYVNVEIADNSYFEVTDGNSELLNVETTEEYDLNLKYLGGSQKLPLKITYKKTAGSVTTITENVIIDEIDDSDSSSNTSNNEPKLIIEGSSIPAAAAGDTMKIPLTVTNESKYSAKNISVKLSLSDGDDNPFDMESMNLIQTMSSLNAKKSEALIFNLKVKPYAAEKTYGILVDFKYYNSNGSYFTDSETIYVKVTNDKNEPVLVVQDIKYSSNPVKAGAKMQASFNVCNVGDLDAKGVKVSIEGLENDKFTLSSGTDSWYFDIIKGGEKKNVVVSLLADDSMSSGNYGLDVKMEYSDQRSKTYSGDSSFFVNVQGSSKTSNLSVSNITVMPQQVKANENFMLSFDITNQGKSAARNVKLSVKGDEGIISKSPDVRMIEDLAAGEQKKLEYILYASSEAKTQNYNILITLEYDDADKEDQKLTVNQYAGVFVNGGNSKITPKIIISNYDFEPKLVRAGEEFNLEMTFMNTSQTKDVKNVKVYLTGIDSDKEGDVVFTPVGSSNTFFFDDIKPKGTIERGITMYTIPDAQPKYYNITANIEYQDEDGTEYKGAELIGIPVIQQSKLDTSEISLPPEIYIGQPSPISLQYYNKGKTKLSNLMIKVEGNFQLENGEAFIGNFDSGSSDYFEAMITPLQPGPADGKVTFSYEDPSGEEFTYERTFSINAIEMPPMEMPGEMPQEPVSTKDKIMNLTIKNKFFWIGAVVVIAGAITARRLIRRKRRKDMELDE